MAGHKNTLNRDPFLPPHPLPPPSVRACLFKQKSPPNLWSGCENMTLNRLNEFCSGCLSWFQNRLNENSDGATGQQRVCSPFFCLISFPACPAFRASRLCSPRHPSAPRGVAARLARAAGCATGAACSAEFGGGVGDARGVGEARGVRSPGASCKLNMAHWMSDFFSGGDLGCCNDPAKSVSLS